MSATVVIVGGGPSGLTAAAELAPHARVLVLEREQVAGGIPRHSAHAGYGMRDLHRLLSGPDYARRLVTRALAAGATIDTAATVTGWTAGGELEVTSPQGRRTVTGDAFVLATGARERSRAARLVPGDRAAGVYTTGHLQNLVHLHGGVPGRRAVVVGAELVSWSAVMTLRESGCRTVLMTTSHPRPESYAAFTLAGRTALRVPVAVRSRVVRVIGTPRVQAVEVEDLDTGSRRRVDCDTVVFTGAWIADSELARAAGLDMDRAMSGPLVDTALRTSHPGVFAIGNLVHPVDTADVAALDGRHVAHQVRAWLGGSRPGPGAVRIVVEKPLRWVSPGLLRPDDPPPPRSRLVLWTDQLIRLPRLRVTQAGRELADVRVPWPASPGRAFRVPSRVLADVDHARGDVGIALS